jgi:hypothetical protein
VYYSENRSIRKDYGLYVPHELVVTRHDAGGERFDQVGDFLRQRRESRQNKMADRRGVVGQFVGTGTYNKLLSEKPLP